MSTRYKTNQNNIINLNKVIAIYKWKGPDYYYIMFEFENDKNACSQFETEQERDKYFDRLMESLY